MKVVIVAHGHPEITVGGGERAAYSLFEHLKGVDGIEATFVARAEPAALGHDGWFGAYGGRPDELLWVPPPFDWFRRASTSPDLLRLQVGALVARLRPEVVHFQHYMFLGLDALGMFKEAGCRTVLTLHEYLLICHHDGQMVKTRDLSLCHEATPADCHACFPDLASGKFFLRTRSIQQLLQAADHLVSPSRFLRDRHVAWGVAPACISVIENPLSPRGGSLPVGAQPRGRSRASRRVRLGFFGQLTRFKGALVLFEAIRHLPNDIRECVEVVVFGAKLEHQQTEFQDAVRRAIADTPGTISLFGAYQHQDVAGLMRSVDWVVVPSTWWENSPLVIQEARAVGTPVLASNIGGMAEKVRDGVDGLHFLAGSPLDLASKIEAIVRREVEVRPAPVDMAAQNRDALDAYLRVYRGGS